MVADGWSTIMAGTVLWDRVTNIWELKKRKESLRKRWFEHEQKIAEEGVDSASENISTSITAWRRAEIKLCIVQLKLFFRVTGGAAARN
jgi:hypothetical protein